VTWLLLLLSLGLAGVGAVVSPRWRVGGQALLGLGVLGLLAVVVVQVRENVFPQAPRTSSHYEMTVSYGLANCLLGDAAGQSGTVVLIFPQRRDLDEDKEASYEDGLIRALHHSRMKLELKAVRLEGAGGDLAVFKQALAQTSEALAVISYAGVPAAFETLFPAGQPEGPPFYVYDGNGTTHWLGALKAGRIRAVIVPQPGVAVHGSEPITGPPDAVFDRFFLMATAANADGIARQETSQK